MELDPEQKKQFDEMCRVKDLIADDYLKRPDVTGIGVGLKEIGGKLTEELAIIISVKEKKDVPAEKAIPTQIKGFVTDVIEFNPAREPQTIPTEHEDDSKKILPDGERYNPLVGGISIGPDTLTRKNGKYSRVGTLGLVVQRVILNRPVKMPYGLTCFHVLGVSKPPENGKVGDVSICQPSRSDDRYYGDNVVCNFSIPVKYVGNYTNLKGEKLGGIDCAIFPIINRDVIPGRIAGLYDKGIKILGHKAPNECLLGTKVCKRGYKTRLTYGTFQAIGDVKINEILFEKQILVFGNNNSNNNIFSEEGDSGSVVVALEGGGEKEGYVIGLHMSGGITDTHSSANPINAVIDALGIKIPRNP